MARRRTNRKERLAEIEQMLLHHTEGLRVIDIARHCDVDRRTIYRDLSMLMDAGLPLKQYEGRFFLDQLHYLATVRLRVHELVALFMAVRYWFLRVNTANPHLISALGRVAESLPDSLSNYVAFLIKNEDRQPVDSGFVHVLEEVTQAWAGLVNIRFWYQTPQDDTLREGRFAVYFIEIGMNGEPHMLGYDYAHDQITAVNLHHVKRVKLLKTYYQIPENLDYTALWSAVAGPNHEPFTEVVLLFSAQVVPLIQQKTDRLSQRIVVMDDKRGLLSMRVTDWKTLLPWIRSWGEHVEVVKPGALRDQIAREAVRVAAVHSMK